VYLSATFTKETLVAFTNQGGKVFNLYHRYHGYPIPILTYQLRPFFLKWIEIVLTLHSFRKANLPAFIFVPTIALGKLLLLWLVLFFPNTKFVYSSSKSRSETIALFKQNPTFFLITTAILERGITVPHLQVIIFSADHVLFTTSMLIQMAGRVGRKMVSPSGKVIAFADRMTDSIRLANAKIQFANAHL
jgi:competence protein ComFA